MNNKVYAWLYVSLRLWAFEALWNALPAIALYPHDKCMYFITLEVILTLIFILVLVQILKLMPFDSYM